MARRAYGTGSIYRTKVRGKELWCAEKAAGKNPNGKRKKIRGFGETQKEAKANLEKNIVKKITQPQTQQPTIQELLQFFNNHQTDTNAINNITIKEIIETKYLPYKEERTQQKTNDNRQGIFKKHILPYVNNTTIDNYNQELIEKILNKSTEPATTKTIYSQIRALTTYLINYGYIAQNPLSQIPKPKYTPKNQTRNNTIIDTATDDVRTIVKQYSQDKTKETETLLLLLLLMGLRRMELLGLTWDCILNIEKKGQAQLLVKQQLDDKKGFRIKPTTKTSEIRTIYLPEDIRHALLKRKQQNRKIYNNIEKYENLESLVFIDDTGEIITPNKLRGIWKRIWKEFYRENYESNKFTIHYMRHIAANLLLQSQSPQTTQSIIGDKEAVLDKYYSHASRKQQQEAAQQLQKWLTTLF
ncbi:tyrosine-type recombinase/integrase [Corynebacterium variabile]|uniref:tyrosine-type recombinase/integrase n=1 Tax=Corynebacterium variabile TaxID=1727 RepID=UPI001476969D|nr:site-specific integrase [Corynebacterium variabile]